MATRSDEELKRDLDLIRIFYALEDRASRLELGSEVTDKTLNVLASALGRMQGHTDQTLKNIKQIREHLERPEGDEWKEGNRG